VDTKKILESDSLERLSKTSSCALLDKTSKENLGEFKGSAESLFTENLEGEEAVVSCAF
jgi:hypothetical protein